MIIIKVSVWFEERYLKLTLKT